MSTPDVVPIQEVKPEVLPTVSTGCNQAFNDLDNDLASRIFNGHKTKPGANTWQVDIIIKQSYCAR